MTVWRHPVGYMQARRELMVVRRRKKATKKDLRTEAAFKGVPAR